MTGEEGFVGTSRMSRQERVPLSEGGQPCAACAANVEGRRWNLERSSEAVSMLLMRVGCLLGPRPLGGDTPRTTVERVSVVGSTWLPELPVARPIACLLSRPSYGTRSSLFCPVEPPRGCSEGQGTQREGTDLSARLERDRRQSSHVGRICPFAQLGVGIERRVASELGWDPKWACER
jgi:hypothetical protein